MLIWHTHMYQLNRQKVLMLLSLQFVAMECTTYSVLQCVCRSVRVEQQLIQTSAMKVCYNYNLKVV